MLRLQAVGLAHVIEHIGLNGALERAHTHNLHLNAHLVKQFFHVRSHASQSVQVNRPDGVQVDAVGNAGQVIVGLVDALVAVGSNPLAALFEFLEGFARLLEGGGSSAHTIALDIDAIHLVVLSGILDDGETLCLYGCEHCVHSSSDCYNVEEYLISGELIGNKVYHALTESILRAESCESLQVLIYRTVSERTSARHGYSCLAELAQKSSQEVIGSTHFSCVLIRNTELIYCRRIDPVCIFAHVFDLSAHFLKDMETDPDIADVRYIFYNARFI